MPDQGVFVKNQKIQYYKARSLEIISLDKKEQVLDIDPELPPSLEGLEDKPEYVVKLGNSYEAFTQFLREHY